MASPTDSRKHSLSQLRRTPRPKCMTGWRHPSNHEHRTLISEERSAIFSRRDIDVYGALPIPDARIMDDIFAVGLVLEMLRRAGPA